MMVPGVEVPVGYTFFPKDEELIEHYLGPKARGEQKFYLCHIAELDVYATEPWNLGIELRHGRNRDAFFCFTRVTRSSTSNGRLLRYAGNGTWHAGGHRTLIRCKDTVAGQKMTNLKFMIRAKKGGKPMATSWIMHEYRLLDPPIDDQGKEMVLYRIQKSGTGFSDEHQLSCLDDFPASTAGQQALRKRKRDQMHCCETAVGKMTSCSTPAPAPCIADDEQLQSTSMSVWEDPVDMVKGSVIQSQPMLQIPCSGDDANPLFCCEMAAGCPAMRTTTSCNTPPPCIAGDEQLHSTSMSVWEDPVDMVQGSVIHSQPMLLLPCSGDDAAPLFCSEMAAGCSVMRTTTNCNTPAPCIVGDEQLECMRTDCATCFRTTSISDWEDPVDISNKLVIQSQRMMQPLSYDDHHAEQPEMNMIGSAARCSTRPVDISNGLVIQSQPMMQPLTYDDDRAQQPERNMIESATKCSTTNTTLWESDWDEADLRKILEMI